MQRLIDRAVDVAAIAAFAGMFACVLGQVGFRYVLGDPLVWSDELARYLFVWASFLGWIIAARRRSHLSIDTVMLRLAPRGQAALRVVGALAGIAFAAVLVVYGWRITQRNLDVETTTLFFSQGVVYAIVPVAAVAVALYALAYLSLVAGVLAGALPWPCLLGLVTLTLAVPAARDVLRHPDDVKALLPAMGRNVMVNLATPAFVAVGLFVG